MVDGADGVRATFEYRYGPRHYLDFARYVEYTRRRKTVLLGAAALLLFPSFFLARAGLRAGWSYPQLALGLVTLAVLVLGAYALFFVYRVRRSAFELERDTYAGHRTLRLFAPGYTIAAGGDVIQHPWHDVLALREYRSLLLLVLREGANFKAGFVPVPDPAFRAVLEDLWAKRHDVAAAKPEPVAIPTDDVA